MLDIGVIGAKTRHRHFNLRNTSEGHSEEEKKRARYISM